MKSLLAIYEALNYNEFYKQELEDWEYEFPSFHDGTEEGLRPELVELEEILLDLIKKQIPRRWKIKLGDLILKLIKRKKDVCVRILECHLYNRIPTDDIEDENYDLNDKHEINPGPLPDYLDFHLIEERNNLLYDLACDEENITKTLRDEIDDDRLRLYALWDSAEKMKTEDTENTSLEIVA